MWIAVAVGAGLAALWFSLHPTQEGFPPASAEYKPATASQPERHPGLASPLTITPRTGALAAEPAAQNAPATPQEAQVNTPADRARQQQRRRRYETGAEEESTMDGDGSEQCAWLGKRIISLLIRDDAMAANDFTPFYLRFDCPEEHLARAFGCVAANADLVENNALADQVDSCWRDPSVRLTPAPPKPESPAGPKSGEIGRKG